MVRGLTSASIANCLWSIPASSRPSLIIAGDSSARISPRANVVESCVKTFDGDHSPGTGRSDSSRIRLPTEKSVGAPKRTLQHGTAPITESLADTDRLLAMVTATVARLPPSASARQPIGTKT